MAIGRGRAIGLLRLATVTAVVLAGIWLFVRVFVPAGRTTLDPPAMVTEIRKLNELATVRYGVQKVVGLKEQKVPVGEESILLIVQAHVVAGVDLDAVREDHVRREAPNTFLVMLPSARILSVEVDEKETKVWDRRVTWWTPWVPFNPDFERQARIQAVQQIKETAIEMGILREAERNAEHAIRSLFRLVQADVVFRPPS
jgi:hypothetical protein